MTLSFNSSFWNSFLTKNPDFAGFGKAAAPVCILSDVFTAAPDADELEIMFRLEQVNSYWKEQMEEALPNPSSLRYLPDYCHHYLDCQLQIHGLNLAKESCFFIPLTIDFYYENEAAWKNKLKERLLAYQPLVSSFSQVYFASRFIEESDFRASFSPKSTQQIHYLAQSKNVNSR
jgi:hypothetical protein